MSVHAKLLIALGAFCAAVAVPSQAQDAPYQREARAILERLVSFRSSEGHGPQINAAADYIVGEAYAVGVTDADIARIPVGETQAVLVRIPGRDTVLAPVLFSAHFDVVDARPEDWEADPYVLSEQSGFFVGRGASDNKADVAALLSTIHRLAAARYRPERTLIFVFIGDEETKQATTRAVVQHPWVAGAAFAINTDAGGGMLTPAGQPLIYFTQGAEKTYASFRLTVRNAGVTGSSPVSGTIFTHRPSGRWPSMEIPQRSAGAPYRYKSSAPVSAGALPSTTVPGRKRGRRASAIHSFLA